MPLLVGAAGGSGGMLFGAAVVSTFAAAVVAVVSADSSVLPVVDLENQCVKLPDAPYPIQRHKQS
jgi:hypothetical protein